METSRPSDRFIPWYIAAFFVAFVLLLCWFSWFAARGYTGEVTKDSYKKGLAYNAVIRKAQEQDALGWKGIIATTAQGLKLRVRFTLNDKSGHPITGAQVNAHCVRPTQDGSDANISLKDTGNGSYAGEVMLAWPGIWNIHISANADGHNYQQVKTIVVK